MCYYYNHQNEKSIESFPSSYGRVSCGSINNRNSKIQEPISRNSVMLINLTTVLNSIVIVNSEEIHISERVSKDIAHGIPPKVVANKPQTHTPRLQGDTDLYKTDIRGTTDHSPTEQKLGKSPSNHESMVIRYDHVADPMIVNKRILHQSIEASKFSDSLIISSGNLSPMDHESEKQRVVCNKSSTVTYLCLKI